MYTPTAPFVTPLRLFVPEYTNAKGSPKKTYTDANVVIYTSFRSFGGTQTTRGSDGKSNGVVVIEDTVTIETWYNPKVTADCILYYGNKPYEILGVPEDIENRHQYMRFKIRHIKGGA